MLFEGQKELSKSIQDPRGAMILASIIQCCIVSSGFSYILFEHEKSIWQTRINEFYGIHASAQALKTSKYFFSLYPAQRILIKAILSLYLGKLFSLNSISCMMSLAKYNQMI